MVLTDGAQGIASVPAGAFAGRYEIHTVPVEKAVLNINGIIAQSLNGQDAGNQVAIDNLLLSLDPSPTKDAIGGNAILGVSLALARAQALSLRLPLYQYINRLAGLQTLGQVLPIPMFNILNGGAHADNNLPFQEFMVVPMGQGLPFSTMMDQGRKVFQTLKNNLKNLKKSTAYGDEGGFAPVLNSNDEAVELLVESIEEAGFIPGKDLGIGIDIAAGNIKDLSAISYPKDPLSYYHHLTSDYPVILLEDPFDDNSWDKWQTLTSEIGNQVTIFGDDLFSTNTERLKKGIELKAANGISIKPNQIGTLSATIAAILMAKEAGIRVQISHRAGETEDTFIADLAIGTSSPYLKAGAPNRGERIAKYNRVLRIARELGKE